MHYENIKNPKELLAYMTKNIKYGSISKTGKIYDNPHSKEWERDWYNECIVQDGNGVLKTGYGTCWDQVELERKWFNDNNYNFKTIFMWFDTKEDLPTHTFLIYKENNKYYWFEHAFEKYRGIHTFNSEQEVIKYVTGKQLEYSVENYNIVKDYEKYIKYIEYNKPPRNLGINAYLDYVLNKN